MSFNVLIAVDEDSHMKAALKCEEINMKGNIIIIHHIVN